MLNTQRQSRANPDNEELYDKVLKMERHLAVLTLFESFLESAPQLILQLYILTATGIGEIY